MSHISEDAHVIARNRPFSTVAGYLEGDGETGRKLKCPGERRALKSLRKGFAPFRRSKFLEETGNR